MVRMRDPKILIAAIEEALLKKLSREWDSAFDKTLESALGV